MSATRESALIVDATQLDSGALRRPEAPPLCFVESYSGVRGAFGDGPTIGNETMAIVLAYAHAFAGDVVLRWSAVGSEKSKLRLIVGRDPRPTSAAIARLQRVGLHLACEELGVELALLDPGIVTTPAIQAMVRDLDADGGVMITGSHNPADFNGLKYLTGNTEPEGRSANDSGSVLNGVKMAAVIAAARRMLRRIAGGDLTLIERANSFAPPANEEVEAAPGYSALLRTVFRLDGASAHDVAPQSRAQGRILVVDANGGAGSTLIPEALGDFVEIVAINTTPGRFAHDIEPVGAALDEASAALQEAGADVAVVVDADADRGDLVARDRTGDARQLHPQEVALLSTVGMLAWVRAHALRYPELDDQDMAVVGHGATSGRVEATARQFGADYFEVETGEVNVVARMHELTEEGYFVPIGVEGSNGGTVFHGTRVRDGALTALMALLTVTDPALVAELRSRYALPDHDHLLLTDLLDALPRGHTVQSLIRIEGEPVAQAALKEAFEAIVLEAQQRVTSGFASAGLDALRLSAVEIFNYEETRTLRGPGNRRSQTGGFKVRLLDDETRPHFVWFRVSKTESGVARIVADSPDQDVARHLHDLANRWYREAVARTT